MYMRIHCGNCGKTWEIYARDDWNDPKARQCPHCFSHISHQVWTKEVLPTFGAFQDANRELYKDATGYHKPIFGVDMIADEVPSTEHACPFEEALRELYTGQNPT